MIPRGVCNFFTLPSPTTSFLGVLCGGGGCGRTKRRGEALGKELYQVHGTNFVRCERMLLRTMSVRGAVGVGVAWCQESCGAVGEKVPGRPFTSFRKSRPCTIGHRCVWRNTASKKSANLANAITHRRELLIARFVSARRRMLV